MFFILNPFLSAVYSFKEIRDGMSHKFLYLWFLVFGTCFCAVNEAADSYRYVEGTILPFNPASRIYTRLQ